MALQALKLGFHAHGMAGFDRERARVTLSVPDNMAFEAVFAIGRLGDPSRLSALLQKRETPSHRFLLKELVFDGHL